MRQRTRKEVTLALDLVKRSSPNDESGCDGERLREL